MESVGSFEAKTHLPQLLERVANGEEFTITKHGKPVARLVPATIYQTQARRPAGHRRIEGFQQRQHARRRHHDPRSDRGRPPLLTSATERIPRWKKPRMVSCSTAR